MLSVKPTNTHSPILDKMEASKTPVKLVKVTKVIGRTGTNSSLAPDVT